MNIAPKIIFTQQLFAKYVQIMTENIFSNINHQIVNDKTEISFLTFMTPLAWNRPITVLAI